MMPRQRLPITPASSADPQTLPPITPGQRSSKQATSKPPWLTSPRHRDDPGLVNAISSRALHANGGEYALAIADYGCSRTQADDVQLCRVRSAYAELGDIELALTT